MLLDSCIMIDVLRGREAALAFVNGLPEAPSLSVITATELIAGVRNAHERRQVERMLAVYVTHDIGLEIASLAGDYLRQYGRSHGIDLIDTLIAATAKTSGLALATLNLKHFPMFKGLRRPYRL
jgi:predicted nucleic acid-binding protein